MKNDSDVQVTDLNRDALTMPQHLVDALWKIRKIRAYVGNDEVDGAGGVREAMYNSLSIVHEDGKWYVTDIDGLNFLFTWENDAWVKGDPRSRWATED